MKKIFYFIIAVLISASCNKRKALINEAIVDNKSNSSLIYSDSCYVDVQNFKNNNYSLTIFKPNGLNIRLASKRPSVCEHNYFCVAAAFTSKTTTIDGLFIERGKKVATSKLDILNGTCVLKNDRLKILKSSSLTESLISEIENGKFSLFQQVLLVYDSKIVDCELFGSSKFMRRALIQFNNSFSVCQSNEALTIKDFQTALVQLGVTNAMYLDMGGWSEGWYKNAKGQQVIIGEGMNSTAKQTNWLVYEVVY